MLSTVTERFLFLPHPVPSKLESVSKQAIRSTVRHCGGGRRPSEPRRCNHAPRKGCGQVATGPLVTKLPMKPTDDTSMAWIRGPAET